MTFIIGLKRKLGLVRRESNTIVAISKHILFRGWYRNPIIIKTQLCLQPHNSQMICNIYPYIWWVFQVSRLQVNTWNFVCKWIRKVVSSLPTLNFPCNSPTTKVTRIYSFEYQLKIFCSEATRVHRQCVTEGAAPQSYLVQPDTECQHICTENLKFL